MNCPSCGSEITATGCPKCQSNCVEELLYAPDPSSPKCPTCGAGVTVDGCLCYVCSSRYYFTPLPPVSKRVPHRCPVCEGTGKVGYPPGTVAGQPYNTTGQVTWDCHKCNGECVIWEEL